MRLSRLLVLIAALALTCASAQAHVGAFGSASKSAPRGFLPDLATASRVIERVTASRVWENYDCGSKSASGLCVDAFGVEIGRSGTTDVEHLYRGERWDANVAAYDLRARLYSPGNGRFLTQDTFVGFSMDPRSLHKYVYANSDPVQYSDPSGNFGVIAVGGLNINIGGAVAFFGTRAGVTAVAKFSAELAFEYATGIPVITSPRGMLQAVRSLRGVVGNLAEGAIKRMKAGRDFESTVAEMWRLKKNTACFKNGVPSQPPGCFIPDFFGTVGGRLVEVKTSMGAVKKLQFQEFVKISRNSGQPMSMVFLKKPSPAEVEQLQRWAVEVTGATDDMLLSIIHVLD